MDKVKVSVIMAVYNGAATLGRMVESVLAQDSSDWELVAVDDGSTDGSGALLDRYAERDSRIRVIHKENGGVASARQAGTDAARGEYTIHADCDDWLEPGMVGEMASEMDRTGADVLIADYYVEKSGEPETGNRNPGVEGSRGNAVRVCQKPDSLSERGILRGLYAKGLFGGLWHKMIRRSFYDKGLVRFSPGIDYCEDMLLLTRIYTSSCGVKTAYIPKAYYHYVVNASSLTQRVSERGYRSLQLFHREAALLLSREGGFEDVVDSFPAKEFTVWFMNGMYSSASEARRRYRAVGRRLWREAGLRWKAGYIFILLGMPGLSRRLLRW